MAKRRFPDDFYWPVGSIAYGDEIADLFPDEASLIGTIAILWNYHEDQLRDVFVRLSGSPHAQFAAAIWDRQPTHQAKRGLLSLALENIPNLTPLQRELLSAVIERTKKIADRRNELLHGVYVVHGNTDNLFAVSRRPNSSKPEKYHKSSIRDLRQVLADLEELMAIRSHLSVTLIDPEGKLIQEIRSARHTWKGTPPEPRTESPESGSHPPSPRPTRQSKRKPPPQS